MSRPSRWTSRAARPSRPSLPGGQRYGEIKMLVNAAGVSPSQAPIEAILKVDLYGTAVLLEEVGRVIALGGVGVTISSQSGWRMPVLTAEQGEKLATTPTEELLSLDFLQPENIRDTLHAYQMAKRCNEKRVTAQAVEWRKRGARLNDIVEKSLRGAAIWDEVKDRLKKNALGLSGGQQQRLCIARALAVEPEVLLMDEPTSALDPISTSKIEELAMELKEKYTIVIVTHNMQQAVRISDHTAFFLLGELVEYGETEKLFSQPQDKRTEDYITGRFG
mgnify:CR=1 FL=1